MSELRIALDTSALRRDPKFASGAVEALARFAEEGHVDILIPKVVAEEFKTLPCSKIESLAELRQTLRNLRRNVPDELHQVISESENRIAEEFERTEAAAGSLFNDWIVRTGATTPGPAPNHAGRVLKRYFSGQPPFRRAKARDDFPDAFIAETIIDLAAEGDLFVVTGDKGLAAAFDGIPNITVFIGVKELIESGEFSDEID